MPVNDESHTLWAPTVNSATGSISDNRNTAMDQPRKYEPTEQKIIFHCNSSNVWHNIHIQFFTNEEGTIPVNGQAFPGYMMEPYAYAGSDYRTSDGYLTYELTIPSTAKSFRITNGEPTNETYGYYTAVTQLNDGSDDDHGKGKKNYANYFHFASPYNDKGGTLEYWSGKPESISNFSYSESEVTSDYDYVYFKAPSGWNNVYAYFYGGGNLRDDNWQRACYSAWPGVAPAGTEYEMPTDTDYAYSTTYTYPVVASGNKYNGNTTAGNTYLSPESYYTVSGEKIYKFHLPQGDRKNYSKVIFNNGLNGSKETGVIDYKAGYIYSKDGSATKHYEKKPTTPYTGRTNSEYTGDDKTEYIYIKNTAGWQDLHITFYDDKDKQILQGGHGYVMDYAGKQDSTDYYRIPIPGDAVKFSVNNGIGKSNSFATGLYDITRLGSNGKSTSEEKASDRFVYNLEGTTSATLTRIGLNEGTPTEVESETVIAQVEDTSNYTPNTPNSGVRQTVSGTDDTLNIRDSYTTKWDLPIGAATVTFYNTAGAVVGSGTMMKTNADNDGYVWYTKKIPINAASFSVSYVKGTAITNTPKYPIYSKTADTTTGDQSTKGDMFYETAGTNKLSMIYADPVLDEADDETYEKRGDYLYLVCDSKSTPSITFYANGDNVLRANVTGKYINEDGKHWYCVSIPKGAESFAINNAGKYPIFELKSKYSRYEKDYTLGDMQYSYNGSTAALLYPIFTKDDEYTLSVSDDKTISSKSGLLTVDPSTIEPYANADSGVNPATSVNVGSTLPVLYNTDSNDITYTWTETAEDENYNYLRFDTGELAASGTDWDDYDVYAVFYNSSSDKSGNRGDANTKMTKISSDSTVFKIAIPQNADNTAKYHYVKFYHGTWSGSANETVEIDLNTYGNGGFGYMLYGRTSTNNSGYRKIDVSEPAGVPNDSTLTFVNNVWTVSSGNAIQAKFLDSNGDQIGSIVNMTKSSSTNWTFDMSANNNPYGSATKVVFSNNGSTTECVTATLKGANGYKGWGYTYTSKKTGYLYVVGEGDFANPLTAFWTDSTSFSDSNALYSGSVNKNNDGQVSNVGNGKYTAYKFEVPDNAKSKLYLVIGTNGEPYVYTGISNVSNGGMGKIYKASGTSKIFMANSLNWLEDLSDGIYDGSWSDNPTYTYPPVQQSSPTTYKVAYQPEDRYGMISEQNENPAGVLGFEDANNFITLVMPNSITTPYIKFYTSTDGSTGYINNDTSSNASEDGFPLNDSSLKLNTSSYTFNKSSDSGNITYKVRLPKNAKSFTITNGTRSGTCTLDESITVKVSDGQLSPASTDDQKEINIHHAGSTFIVNENATVNTQLDITLTDVRDGYTVTRQAAMTDPLNPRTDADYVFFTDKGNTIGGGSGIVYAYFYGGADGEYNNGSTANTYTPWPGIKATTANDGVAETTYTDNDGNTVYMFRVPHGENGNYPYVIFNNGVSGIKITQAAEVVAGKNYVLKTPASGQYGTFATTVYPVEPKNKANTNPTVDYGSSSSKYIYIVNNGPYDLNGGTRTPLDDMHVVFYDSSKNVIGTGYPGYKPDKVVENGSDKRYSGSDVYRIAAPSNAKYFQITNGTKAGTANDNERMSEIKAINADGLYRFVPSATNAVDYIEESAYDSSTQKQSDMHFLLDIINVVTVSDEELSVDGITPVHVATVVTGDDGKTAYIKWVKDYPSETTPPGSIDNAYIANTIDEIGESAGKHQVKVNKRGDYYWKEAVAPSGYQVNPANIGFTVSDTTLVTTTVPDPPNPTGQLTLNKKLKKISADNATIDSAEKNTQFTFTVTLTAPVGTDWTALENDNNTKLTFSQVDNTQTPAVTTSASVTEDTYSSNNLTRTFKLSIPATGTTDFVISNIPSGTSYSVTETSPDNYSDTPVYIYKDNVTTTNLDKISGNIPSEDSPATNNVSYAVTNKREIGGLTLEKVAEGSDAALATAGINPYNEDTKVTTYTEFTYTVTLTAPTLSGSTKVDFRDYIKWADFTALGATVTKINDTDVEDSTEEEPVTITSTTYTDSSTPVTSIRFDVSVKANNGSKLVKNLPIGTKYTVTEKEPAAQQQINWSKSGEVTTETEMDEDNLNPTVTIKNSYGGSEIILTKTAKEKVGTTDIGSPLAGAEFLVYKNDGDSDDNNDVLAGKFTQAKNASNQIIKGEYNYNNTSGTFNVIDEETDAATGLTTGDDSLVTDHYGKLILKGLPVGDYYLKEIKAPNGYSNLDSNNLKNGVAQPKRIYFSVGDNTKTKEISCADEMAPAYIKLFEHINEWRPSEWGNPTFIFKIKQTGYYAWSEPAEPEEPEWQLTATNSGKEILVALTVNDDGTLDTNVLTGSVTGKTFTGWKVESTDENIAVDENTTVKEYQGMFDIDSQGRIRVEPGSYEITRMPVSRYEFVTSAKTAPYNNSGTAGDQTENLDSNSKPLEKVTISPLEAGKTVDVHYYDEVAYYDKFSQVDEEINKFYTLDENTKANKTIKGIRIADYHQVGTEGDDADTVEVEDTSTKPATTTTTITVPVGNLKIYKVYVDGTEELMSADDYEALSSTNFNITYTYDSESGDKIEFGGKAASGDDPAIPA